MEKCYNVRKCWNFRPLELKLFCPHISTFHLDVLKGNAQKWHLIVCQGEKWWGGEWMCWPINIPQLRKLKDIVTSSHNLNKSSLEAHLSQSVSFQIIFPDYFGWGGGVGLGAWVVGFMCLSNPTSSLTANSRRTRLMRFRVFSFGLSSPVFAMMRTWVSCMSSQTTD